MNTAPHQQVNFVLSYLINKSRKRKSKNKSFDHMCSNIGTMAESLAAMVPKLDGLINVLSNDKNISDLQGKLYGEISKIEGLADEKII